MTRTPSEFGARLEQELARSGLTQQSLASHLGVSQQTISKWATGETTPRLRHVPRIEAILEVPTGSLSTLLFAPHSPSAAQATRSGVPALAGLQRQMADLDGDEVVKVAAFVEGLLRERG